MSPTHLCRDDDLAVEPEVGGEDKQEDIDKGEIICNCTNSLCCACHHKKSCRCANYHPERSTWHCTCTYFKARPCGPRPNMVPTCGSLKHPEQGKHSARKPPKLIILQICKTNHLQSGQVSCKIQDN